jgi:hypothetical protein
MYAPMIRSANTVKQYRIGRYEAVLLDTIEEEGSIGYEYIIAVFEPGVRDPFLFVTSERNNSYEDQELLQELGISADDIEATESGSSHFLCIFDKDGHYNLGDSDAWGDMAAFEKEAMNILAARLGDKPIVVA